MYDPVVARFMSADPVVVNLANSQHFNRYSYVSNRPLAATDPSGYAQYDFYEDLDKPKKGNSGFSVSWGYGGSGGSSGYLQLQIAMLQMQIMQQSAMILQGHLNVMSANAGVTGSTGGLLSDQERERAMAEQAAGQGAVVREGEGQAEGLGKESNGESPDTSGEPWRIPMPVWTNDPDVKRETGRIWEDSRTDLPPTKRYEQGGWAVEYWWSKKGDYDVIRVPPGLPDQTPWMVNPPSVWNCLCTVKGPIHSHPLGGLDGPYDPFRPSGADLQHSKDLGMPGVIVTFPKDPKDGYQLIPYQGK